MMRGLLVAVVLALCAAGQDKPKAGHVSGTVVDAQSGDPIAKALVVIGREGFQVGAWSDAAGKFALTEVEPGSYSIDVQRRGYVVARGSQKQVAVPPGTEVANIAIKL